MVDAPALRHAARLQGVDETAAPRDLQLVQRAGPRRGRLGAKQQCHQAHLRAQVVKLGVSEVV